MFITFEGGDGAGKTTQVKLLERVLNDHSYNLIITREPGGTDFGEIARSLVLDRTFGSDNLRFKLGSMAELLLFASARAQHVDELINPALQSGAIVICDRFTDSTLAYQGYGRGIEIDDIKKANLLATQGLQPDLTVLLDIPTSVGLARRYGYRLGDAFENETTAFHERVRQGFLKLAQEDPDRWLIVDATKSVDSIGEAIWLRVSELLHDSMSVRGHDLASSR